ncbi:O-antigen ligase family protein [Aurantiacibacter spongiae]|nr:O-antigen ligase family protein [Aurantiacibacter spongiae]
MNRSSSRQHHKRRTRSSGARRGPQWFALQGHAAFVAFVVLCIFIMLLGGASRYDVQTLPWLRTGCILVLAVAVWKLPPGNLRAVRWPLLLVLALALVMVVQVIPLPPALWESLPHRDIIVEIQEAARMPEVWRPITFSPARTLNSLASLSVPLAVLAMLAWLTREERRNALWVFVAMGAFSAVLGLLQLVLPGSDNLYFYDITNAGDAVGVFANRNHNAVFLALCLLAVLWRERTDRERMGPSLRIWAWAAAGLLLVGILVNPSRAGLLILALVILITVASRLLFRDPASGHPDKAAGRFPVVRKVAGTLVPLICVVLLVALLFGQGRVAAFSRLIAQDPLGEQRAQYLPIFLQMADAFKIWGAGFGAFQEVFRLFEPVELLGPRYLNNAHNDWLQVVIEGGLPALLVVLGGIVLLARRALSLLDRSDQNANAKRETALALLLVGLIAVASLFDYPLRTPIFMALLVYCLVQALRPPNDSGGYRLRKGDQVLGHRDARVRNTGKGL